MTDINCTVMFPYPSGMGLHLGHAYNYALMDSYCRWNRLRGHSVFQPFGYDAFGLPAENYARKMGRDPRDVTNENITRFREQMKFMNTNYDERLITTDASYQHWSQWIFLRLQEKGLAFKKFGKIHYCPECDTVLANEQVKDGKCERHGILVEERELDQWYFRTTAYKDRLILGLKNSGLPEKTQKMQKAWLENLNDWCVSRQRPWGCPIPIEGEKDTLDTFVDSSFYYLRYMTDSQNDFLPKNDYKPVDLYVGGVEHACMHLVYARFIHYFLFDLGIVPQEEPFKRVIHQGMITKNGRKMSKSSGETVDFMSYNQDELRMHLMFIGHYFDGGEWNDRGIVGVRRFFKRFDAWMDRASTSGEKIDVQSFEDHINWNVENFKLNKVVSSWMEFLNKNQTKDIDFMSRDRLKTMLNCFAPGRI